jgi:hypothetical protein
MLAITDDAKELLRDVLEQRGQPGQALRLSETAEDLEVTLDQAAEDDAIYDVDGRDVPIVQRDLADSMDGPRLAISE